MTAGISGGGSATGASARALLARHGLRPKKSWGQNFLEDPRVIARIVDAAGAAAGSPVVEIGAGLGALTRALADRDLRVMAIERDPDLLAVLQAELGDRRNLEIIAADALTFDFAAAAGRAGGPLTVLGNLPYQITTPLLFRILGAAAAGAVVGRAVLMVQKEVAERITARPGSKIYGRLSVMVQQAAEATVLFHVGAGAFLPPPLVTSTVFALVPRSSPRAAVVDPRLFAAVVRAAFGGRRKMLRRSLEPSFGAQLAPALDEAGVAGTLRAEQLAVEDFARLTNALTARGAHAPGGAADLAEDDDA
jgi:16S rRNA (adenine1518-N6/adenine1519-N6)-dimethyltransferase